MGVDGTWAKERIRSDPHSKPRELPETVLDSLEILYDLE